MRYSLCYKFFYLICYIKYKVESFRLFQSLKTEDWRPKVIITLLMNQQFKMPIRSSIVRRLWRKNHQWSQVQSLSDDQVDYRLLGKWPILRCTHYHKAL